MDVIPKLFKKSLIRYLFLISITFGLYSCSSLSENENQITILVTAKNIPAGKLYIGDAYYLLEKTMDSANRQVGDTFVFHLNLPADFEPQLVSLYYFDQDGKANVLAFRNYVLSPSGPIKYAMTSFILERGATYIEGDNLSANRLDIRAQRQTDVLFHDGLMGFGFINNKNKDDRPNAINKLKAFIDRYPFSFYLLQCIYNNKDLYSKQELREIIALFDNSVRHSKVYNMLASYIEKITDPGLPFPDMKLLTNESKKESVIDSVGKLHLLVFWASWCGPCRQEIPDLKKLDSIYRNDGLNICSIAINDSKVEWTKAIDTENMPWQQFFADSTETEIIKPRFLIGAIPVVIFVDRNGKEIKRNIGYDTSRLKADDIFIGEYLHSH